MKYGDPVFHNWLEANKEDMEIEWLDTIDCMGDVEVYEDFGITKREAMSLNTDGSRSAFLDFCYDNYGDSQA